MSSTPTKTGFYWAKWKIADEGTREGDELTPSDRWEVVEVCDNYGDDPRNYLRVSVSGVFMSQSIENFYWGPGPLEAPK